MKSTETRRWHKWNIIYLAATRREVSSGGRQKRRVIWRSPEEKSYLAAAKKLRGSVKSNLVFSSTHETIKPY